MKINDLSLYRYSVTTRANDKIGLSFVHSTPLGQFTVSMATTYKNLIELHINNLEKNSSPASFEQVKRNHMTAIRGFMRHFQKHETTAVGNELGSDFVRELNSYIGCLELAERSKRDRRSLLYAWRDTFSAMGVEALKTKREKPCVFNTRPSNSI